MPHVRSLPTLLVAVLATATACDGAPRIDASSAASCSRSIDALATAANASPDSQAVAVAMQTVAGGMLMDALGSSLSGGLRLFGDADAPSVDRPTPDSTMLLGALCEAMDGFAARDIVERASEIAPAVSASLDRRLDSLHIIALEEAKAAADVARDSLASFVVSSAELRQRPGFLGLEATIVLDVENGTSHSVSRAYFRARAVSEGRSVPWLEETFNYEIPGGLEPGESARWRLEPNAFQGDWGKVRVPTDARFEVAVVKLDGADGEPLWDARFTRGDALLLDSLRARLRP